MLSKKDIIVQPTFSRPDWFFWKSQQGINGLLLSLCKWVSNSYCFAFSGCGWCQKEITNDTKPQKAQLVQLVPKPCFTASLGSSQVMLPLQSTSMASWSRVDGRGSVENRLGKFPHLPDSFMDTLISQQIQVIFGNSKRVKGLWSNMKEWILAVKPSDWYVQIHATKSYLSARTTFSEIKEYWVHQQLTMNRGPNHILTGMVSGISITNIYIYIHPARLRKNISMIPLQTKFFSEIGNLGVPCLSSTISRGSKRLTSWVMIFRS